MEILVGDISLKKKILETLDEFRKFCTLIDDSKSTKITNTATLYWWDLFDTIITSDAYKIFLSVKSGECIGIITGFLLPQLRKWEYCLEIEEFYVKELYQWSGLAIKLMDSLIAWWKEKWAKTVRLESWSKSIPGL